MLATITTSINNALRIAGKSVPSEHYRTEESFMPQSRRHKTTPEPKTWSGVVSSLGF